MHRKGQYQGHRKTRKRDGGYDGHRPQEQHQEASQSEQDEVPSRPGNPDRGRLSDRTLSIPPMLGRNVLARCASLLHRGLDTGGGALPGAPPPSLPFCTGPLLDEIEHRADRLERLARVPARTLPERGLEMADANPIALERFVTAQAPIFTAALSESKAGRKCSH